ncbi:hypothetical protein CIRG_09440 [Coccidioides immitis RMSCC 2394]|uniref:Uncharacterized protein n=1 Tax=Coccidioides immitis RMSCC 2394 TaxID=404692 RepID=A0A0J6YNI9_COCIT|nr:hypothetical protein CIRG_09440 [Coccidioides immitis RMSCC 2394]
MGLVQAGSEWIEPLLLRNPPPTVERRRRRGSRASRSLAEPFELRSSTLGSLGNVRLAEPGLDLEAPPHNPPHLRRRDHSKARKKRKQDNPRIRTESHSPQPLVARWSSLSPGPDPLHTTANRGASPGWNVVIVTRVETWPCAHLPMTIAGKKLQ